METLGLYWFGLGYNSGSISDIWYPNDLYFKIFGSTPMAAGRIKALSVALCCKSNIQTDWLGSISKKTAQRQFRVMALEVELSKTATADYKPSWWAYFMTVWHLVHEVIEEWVEIKMDFLKIKHIYKMREYSLGKPKSIFNFVLLQQIKNCKNYQCRCVNWLN